MTKILRDAKLNYFYGAITAEPIQIPRFPHSNTKWREGCPNKVYAKENQQTNMTNPASIGFVEG